MIEKILQKREIKKANDMDTFKEDSEIVNMFMNQITHTKSEDQSKEEKITTLPIIKCRTLFDKYKKAFDKMNEVFSKYRKYNTDQVKEQFYNAFSLYDDIQNEFTECMIEYGEWVPADTLDLPEKFMMTHDELMNENSIDIYEKSIDILQKVNPFIVRALEEENKGMCMGIVPYITGCCYNIFYIIEKDRA